MWRSSELEENESQTAKIKSIVLSRNLWIKEGGSRDTLYLDVAMQKLSNLRTDYDRPSVPNSTSMPLYSFAFKGTLGYNKQIRRWNCPYIILVSTLAQTFSQPLNGKYENNIVAV